MRSSRLHETSQILDRKYVLTKENSSQYTLFSISPIQHLPSLGTTKSLQILEA
jgi:hypothetical protein